MAPEAIVGVWVGAELVPVAGFVAEVVVRQVRRHPVNDSWMARIGDRAPHYDGRVPVPPPDVTTWIALTHHALDVRIANEWLSRPECGAVVMFNGLVRDHAEGTTGVTHIDYEAYAEEVIPRMEALVEQARLRWPDLVRVVLWHREGRVMLAESSVVVAVSSPHRGTAFEASRFLIDALKATIPIWKKEFWNGGSEWARGSQHIVELVDLASDVSGDATSDVEASR